MYSGDGNYTPSTSAVYSLVVNKAGTTTTLTPVSISAVYGQAEVVTATVKAASPGAGTPTGTVTFSTTAGTVLGTMTLASGTASLPLPSLAPGVSTITATYKGDGNFNTSTSAAITDTVKQDGATVVLTSNPTTAVYGQPVTLTATLSAAAPGMGTPTGLVNFYDGGKLLGTGTLGSGGTATLLVNSILAVGKHSVTAGYQGDANFIGVTSSAVSLTVNQAATTTTLSASSSTSTFGQPVTLTATVSPVAPGSGQPSQSVSFYDGSMFLGTENLNSSGVATLTTTGLAVGAQLVTAKYTADTNFTLSTSSAVIVTVAKSATTAVVSSAISPSVYGQPVVFSVTVSPAAGGSVPVAPTGSVTFKNGSTTIGTATLSGGTATSNAISNLPVGTLSITAIYAGDGNYTGTTSSVVVQVVNPAATTTTVTSPINPAVFGQLVSYTATVAANTPSTAVPSGGLVSFFDGGNLIGTATLSGGTATLPRALGVGSQAITASYGGSTNYSASPLSTALTEVINQSSTTTTLSASTASTSAGQGVTFTASVKPIAPGAGTPTGSLTFSVGSTQVVVKLTGGTAIWKTTGLPVGADTVTASYSGDTNFAQSGSNPWSVTINGPVVSSSPPMQSTALVENGGTEGTGTASGSEIANSGSALAVISTAVPPPSVSAIDAALILLADERRGRTQVADLARERISSGSIFDNTTGPG
jgi:hypothetical protein